MYQSTLDGRFTEVDPLFAAMLGYDSAGEMVEGIRNIAEEFYVEPGVRSRLLGRLMTQNAICNFETQVYRKDGEVLWVSEYSRLIRSDDGNIAGFYGAFSDISLYRRLLDQQTDSNSQVVQKLSTLKQAISEAVPQRILIKDGARIKFMDTSKITVIKSDGDYIHVHGANGEHTMARDRISNMERRIGGIPFLRISKSALVNVNYIKEMFSKRNGTYEVLLDSGERLASGPTYRETVRKLLKGVV